MCKIDTTLGLFCMFYFYMFKTYIVNEKYLVMSLKMQNITQKQLTTNKSYLGGAHHF